MRYESNNLEAMQVQVFYKPQKPTKQESYKNYVSILLTHALGFLM